MRNRVKYMIGVDTGGRFIDVVIIGDDGGASSGKSPTTSTDLTGGLIESVSDAAAVRSLTLEELLGGTRVFPLQRDHRDQRAAHLRRRPDRPRPGEMSCIR